MFKMNVLDCCSEWEWQSSKNTKNTKNIIDSSRDVDGSFSTSFIFSLKLSVMLSFSFMSLVGSLSTRNLFHGHNGRSKSRAA